MTSSVDAPAAQNALSLKDMLRRVLLLSTTTALALGLSGCVGSRASEAQHPKPVKARVVPVVERQLERKVESVGSLFAFEEVTVGAEVEGRVDAVYVDVGDRVTRGSPLVKIVPVELSLALDQQRAALKQIEAQLTTPDGAGEVTDPKDAAEVKRAEGDRTDAEQKYQRAKDLLEQGLLARGAFDEAEARYTSARAAYDMAVQNVHNLRAQQAQREASVALADKKLRDTVIRAPFAGQVKERMVTPGQYVKVQTPAMVIVDSDPLRVRLKVPEKMAAWVAVGRPVNVQVEAFPDRTFEGRVSRINPSVDPQTRTFEVEALLENKDGSLKPGFFARAIIASNHVDTALLVPQQALRYTYGVYKLYAVEHSGLRETEVKLGARDGEDVEIVDGIKSGERVAVPVGGEELRDGAPVAAVE